MLHIRDSEAEFPGWLRKEGRKEEREVEGGERRRQRDEESLSAL